MLLLFGLTLSLDASVKKVTGSFITVAEAGTTYVGDSSEQTYYINSSTEAGAMIRIIDKTGNNTIKLASGLRITSSKVVHNELVLTLSNGAIVNIRGADNFSYIANGRRSFSSFVTSTLGLSSVPDEGESVANGGSAYIPYPYSSPAPSPTDASTTLTAPTLSSKTNTTINLTLGTFTDADGTQNVTVKLYDNPALTNLVATDAAGSFTVLSASTSYYAVTTGEAKNGASGAWEVKSSSALITATDANDSTPDAFSFIDQTDVALSTPIESNTITVAGINIASALSVTTGEYQINGGAWSSANATVNNGDILKVRHTSSASVATDTNTSLTIGGVSDTFTLTTVANTAPTITSSATVDSAENQTAVITVTATDAQNDTRTYTLTGGADQAFFEINTTSGVLTFENAPDFETPADSDAGNDYVVEVTATDDGAGTLSDSQTITISVTDEVEAGLTELYIKSAVYDNNRTGTTADDKLYIYFNKTIDENSIAVDTGSNYVLEGTGAIGSASASDYNDIVFHRHTIGQDGGSTGSEAISTANDTNISMALSTITDTDGDYPQDYNRTIVEKFIYVKKTGQTQSYQENDDGHYQTGVTPSYTRDASTKIVTDNLTGLMWQDDVITTKQWLTTANYNICDNNNSDPVCYDTSGDTAATYCAALGIGGFNDWRMPTSKELEGIVDYSRRDPSIDPTFTNTSSDFYWSSTSIKGYEDYAWLVYFYHGLVHNGHKDGNDYVRCVRDGQ